MTADKNAALVGYRREPVNEDAAAAILTLNRPEQLNAMNWEMIKQFDAAVSQASADPDVRALLITGAGRAFSAGGGDTVD